MMQGRQLIRRKQPPWHEEALRPMARSQKLPPSAGSFGLSLKDLG